MFGPKALAVPLPDDYGYGVIYADPPWNFETWSELGDDRSPDYAVLDLDIIKSMDVWRLAAADSVLFLWAVDPMLDKAFEVIEAWGFEFKTVGFYWIKTGVNVEFPMGLGYWTRGNPETCLLATRGSPKRFDRGVPRLIKAPRMEHSRKPDEAHARIERLCAGPYLELFARRPRAGWSCWGKDGEITEAAYPANDRGAKAHG